MKNVTTKLLVIIFLGTFCLGTAIAQDESSIKNKNQLENKMKNDGRHDFDFITGNWKIVNKRLKKRLDNNNDWTEFEAHSRGYQSLGGLASMDEFTTDHFGVPFVGMSVRLFDPKSGLWTIYWADNVNTELRLAEQVKGSFEGKDTGTFYGEEMFNGKMTKLRFLWKKPTATDSKAYWEQAYFDDQSQEWETNWIMEFSKID